jgi:DNA-binding PadR family transcriptional regulator
MELEKPRRRRAPFNVLSLAVLALLHEHPMHPYEVAYTMRERRMEDSIKLNYGALYHTVGLLQADGLIAPLENERPGRRPERTVYSLTDAGRSQALDWLRDLLRHPRKEFPRFQAGLTVLTLLPRDEALALLGERAEDLAVQIQTERAAFERLRERGIQRLVLLEDEYALAMRQAELDWITHLCADIGSGHLAWQTQAG